MTGIPHLGEVLLNLRRDARRVLPLHPDPMEAAAHSSSRVGHDAQHHGGTHPHCEGLGVELEAGPVQGVEHLVAGGGHHFRGHSNTGRYEKRLLRNRLSGDKNKNNQSFTAPLL
jgi:hypothetical protein